MNTLGRSGLVATVFVGSYAAAVAADGLEPMVWVALVAVAAGAGTWVVLDSRQ